MRRSIVTLVALALGAALVPPALAGTVPTDPNAYLTSQIDVPSFDQTPLHVTVFRPAAAGSATSPVILTFNPYDNTGGSIAGPYASPTNNSAPTPPGGLVTAGMFERGYTFVRVDDRGTGGSGGCFDLWGPDSIQDGKWMIDWAASQPWSSGQVLTYGASAGAISQLAALATHPARLLAAALVQAAVGSSEVWTNGVQNTTGTAWGPAWELNRLIPPSVYSSPGYVQNAEGRNAADPQCHAEQTANALSDPSSSYWQARDAVVGPVLSSITPVLWAGGFNDYNAREVRFLDMFNSLHADHWGFFGPYEHGIATGPNGESFDRITLDWYDHWVKGTPLQYEPRTLVQGVDGTWRGEQAWPPADVNGQTLPIAAGTYSDNADNQEEARPPSALNQGQPSVGTGQGSWTFSPPLPNDVRIAGAIGVSVNVQTPVPVSLVALVYDIDPSGNAVFVAHGADRIAASGTAAFSLYPQDWKFASGHRIGLLLSGADVYWFDPSNTGATVTVTGGTLTLPALRCQRNQVPPAGVPNFVPRKVPPPFTVSSATISGATVDAPPPPAMTPCS